MTDLFVTAVRTAIAPWKDFEFEVITGPDLGSKLHLNRTTPHKLLLGTSGACDLKLTDPGVSRRHVAVELVQGAVRLLDLGSTNGTVVDGVRAIEVLLKGTERVTIGQTVLRVTALDESRILPPAAIGFGGVIGASEAMRRVYPLCERLAQSELPVVIEGETGTGKEALAEALYERSPRRNGPFVVFDCTTVSASLLEAELFGHEKGAFTGAVTSRPGVFEQAHGGVLFIDEIGDLELALQPRLLRAIERKEVRRVGGNDVRVVDVRVITATRRDLDLEVQAGRFRDDLFHRIAVTRIQLPPLRERVGDVELLARAFWFEGGGKPTEFPTPVLERWNVASWPGNVRELRNAVDRLRALGTDIASTPPVVSADALDMLINQGLAFPVARDLVLADFERRYLTRALERSAGDAGKAATASGVGLRYFQKLRARLKR